MLLTVGIVGHRKAKVLVKDRRNFQCSSKCWKDLTEGFDGWEVPRLHFRMVDFGHWRHFGPPGSILDGQGSCQFFKLQLKGISHWNLVFTLEYSRPVSMELGFSLYDALETMNSLGCDVTLTCLVVICLLLNLLVTALLNGRVGPSYRTASPAYFSKPCNSYDRPGVHVTPRTGLAGFF